MFEIERFLVPIFCLPTFLAAQERIDALEARLLDPSPLPDDHFGFSVAVRGDLALIGATGPLNGQGAVHIHERAGDAWQRVAEFSGELAGDRLGSDVAIDGETLVAGAADADNAGFDVGAVYVYERCGGA